jgi:photosystem II stability/assembly factor-like uncharacterized protein
MTRRTFTRRAFAALGAVTALAGCSSSDDGGSGGGSTSTPVATSMGESTPVDDKVEADKPTGAWHKAESPTGRTLYDVVVSRAGVFAVGEDGIIVGRCHGIWERIDKDSPNLEVVGNTLYDASTPEDGRNVWFCGSSGAIGVYEPKEQELLDYSAPGEKTSTWETIAVAGTKGQEYIFVGNGSGELLRGRRDGKEINWIDVREPEGGSTLVDMEFPTANVGFLADSSGELSRTTDAGDSWNNIGVRGASHALHSIGAADEKTVFVSADAGAVYRYNGTTWTELDAGQASVHGIDIVDRKTGLACTAEGGVYSLKDGRWNEVGSFDGQTLHSIIYGNEAAPHVAVGSGGTIVERFPNANDDS